MQRLRWILGCSLVLFFLACEQQDADRSIASNTSSHDSPVDSSKHPSVDAPNNPSDVILLRSDTEIEFRGDSIAEPHELRALVLDKVSNENRKIELAIKLAVDVDQPATVGFLKQVVLALHSEGFYNLSLLSEGAKTRIPKPFAQSSESRLDSVTLTLAPMNDGSLCGIKIDAGGEFSMIESVELDRLIQYARSSLEKLLVQYDRGDSNASGGLEIEMTTAPHLSAQDFLAICGSISSLIEVQDSTSSRKITLWPFGYPRETPLDTAPLQLLEIEQDEIEPIGPPIPQAELKPLDIDGQSSELHTTGM